MFWINNRRRALARLLPVLVGASLVAGCAAADKTASTAASSTTVAAASGLGSSSSGMAGMTMGSISSGATGSGAAVDGIKPVPTQVLGSTTWQGMKITAQAMTAVPFVIYNGTSEQEVKPTSKTSFHLMVMLNDAQTNVAIPYASVWAT